MTEPSRKRKRCEDATAESDTSSTATATTKDSKRFVHISVLQHSQSAHLPPDLVVLDADTDDVVDLKKRLHNCFLFVYNGKELDDRGSLEAAGLVPNDAKSPHVLHRTTRIGRGSQLALAGVRACGTDLTRDWDERRHRSAAEVCQAVEMPLTSESHLVTVKLAVVRDTYRLDSKSISRHNVTLMVSTEQSDSTGESKETKVVAQSVDCVGFLVVEDCQIAVQHPASEHEEHVAYAVVYLVPTKPFELGKTYAVFINHPEHGTKGDDWLTLRNPYCPPGVGPKSYADEINWRQPIGGGARFVFRLTE